MIDRGMTDLFISLSLSLPLPPSPSLALDSNEGNTYFPELYTDGGVILSISQCKRCRSRGFDDDDDDIIDPFSSSSSSSSC